MAQKKELLHRTKQNFTREDERLVAQLEAEADRSFRMNLAAATPSMTCSFVFDSANYWNTGSMRASVKLLREVAPSTHCTGRVSGRTRGARDRDDAFLPLPKLALRMRSCI